MAYHPFIDGRSALNRWIMNRGGAQKLGRLGEEKVVEYLKFQEYTILCRNYRWARGEIDIIAEKAHSLIFFEIKTSRLKSNFGSPETWVNPRKQKQIATTALKYLQSHQIEDVECRFDVIGVIYDGYGNWYFRHLKNAFWL